MDSTNNLNFVLTPEISEKQQIIELSSDDSLFREIRTKSATELHIANNIISEDGNLQARKKNLINKLLDLSSTSEKHSHTIELSDEHTSVHSECNILLSKCQNIKELISNYNICDDTNFFKVAKLISTINEGIHYMIQRINSINCIAQKNTINHKEQERSFDSGVHSNDSYKELQTKYEQLEKKYVKLGKDKADSHKFANENQKIKEENASLKQTIQKMSTASTKESSKSMENTRLCKLAQVLAFIPKIRNKIIKKQTQLCLTDKEIEYQNNIEAYLNKIKILNDESQRLQNRILILTADHESNTKLVSLQGTPVEQLSREQVERVILTEVKYKQEIHMLKCRINDMQNNNRGRSTSVKSNIKSGFLTNRLEFAQPNLNANSKTLAQICINIYKVDY